jgi:hypothetical protein
MNRIDREIVAYHEAGHAVIGYRFGQRFADLSIQSSNGREGFCHFFSGLNNPKHAALVLLAGHAAEKHLCQSASKKPSRSDHRKICQLTGAMSSSEFKALLKQADELVTADWHQIQAVAKRLLEEGMVKGGMFAEIIEAKDTNRDG